MEKKINKKIENKILSLNHSKFLEKKTKILLTNHYKVYSIYQY